MAHQFYSSVEMSIDILPKIRAVVVEWQTRYLEGVVGVRPWRFESSLPHQINYDNSLRSKEFFSVFNHVRLTFHYIRLFFGLGTRAVINAQNY